MRKGIIFDLDGTLVNCMPDFCTMITNFLNKVGADVREPITENQVKSFIGNGARKALARMLEYYGVTTNQQDENAMIRVYMNAYNAAPLDKSFLFKNVKETLPVLQKQNYKMAVCTNKPRHPSLLVLEKLGIKDFFHTVITAEMTPFLKPDIELMQLVVSRMGLNKDEVVMVGDSEVDVMAAKNIGIPSIVVSYGFSSKPVETLGADVIIDDFADLPDTLGSF